MQLPRSFSRSLGAGLEKRLQQNQYFRLQPPATQLGLIDFGSNDSLGLRSSASVRKRFLEELNDCPGFPLGAGGSRILDGSDRHVTKLEKYLAEYHGAEDGLFFNSGYEANVAIFRNLPRPGDAIIHDEKIHASMHDGIRASRASLVREFVHNDVDSLGKVIEETIECSSDIREGKATVFVAIESFYSMDGDMSPVRDMLSRARDSLPNGNVVFIIDEAHSTGLIGPDGSGYIRHLGLHNEGIIQMHSYAKAPGALGAIVLCHKKVKEYLTNYARSLIYSTGPTYPTVATVKACVEALRSQEGQQRREELRNRTRLFHENIFAHRSWDMIQRSNTLSIPSMANKQADRFSNPIIPIVTRSGLCVSLQQTLRERGILSHALHYPVVPRTSERVRVVMHAENTPEDVTRLTDTIMEWGVRNIEST